MILVNEMMILRSDRAKKVQMIIDCYSSLSLSLSPRFILGDDDDDRK